MKEIEKYQIIYSGGHRTYGHANHGKDAYEFVIDANPSSIIDLGCGHNDFNEYFKSKGIRCIGVDFACPSADIICSMEKLPIKDKEFDLVTSFDALEHLTPDLVIPTLSEMERVSHRYIVSISYVPSKILVNGENLHPTVRSKEWWKQQFQSFGDVFEYKHYLYGKWI
jgi:ubiquinone/menaquinone biosynthesis C-methylase UbiE